MLQNDHRAPTISTSPSHLGRARSNGKREFDPDGDVRRKISEGRVEIPLLQRKRRDVRNCLWFAEQNCRIRIMHEAFYVLITGQILYSLKIFEEI